MALFCRRISVSCVALLVVVLLASCSRIDKQDAPHSEWTIRKGAVQLQEDLRVSDKGELYFGSIRDVAVDRSGRIYVADAEVHHIKVLSPGGHVLDSIGTQGQGPGEFQRPSQVTLAPRDSLHVLDEINSRISVFSPETTFEYSFLAHIDKGYLQTLMVPKEGRSLIGVFYPFREDVENPRAVVRPIQASGSIGDTLLTAQVFNQVTTDRDWGTLGSPVPFSPHSHFAAGPDGSIYHGWGDSLKVNRYAPTGQRKEVVSIPFDPVPVTEKEIDEELESRPSELGGHSVSWDFLRDHMPATKPAFNHFLVDGEGRYWFGRPTANPDSTAWWVAMPDEKRVVTETLSSDVEILTVQNGQAYGRTTTDMGAPALVRYRIQFSE